jgi:hypothetical protein
MGGVEDPGEGKTDCSRQDKQDDHDLGYKTFFVK